MRPHYILLGFVSLVALSAGVMLLPEREEQIAMLIRDRYNESARREFTSTDQAGDRSPQRLRQIVAVASHAGEVGMALDAINAYLTLQPRDVEAHEKRVELCAVSCPLDTFLQALEALVAVQPTRQRVAHLLGLYRLHARFDLELSLMRSLMKTPLLGRSDLVRLGALLVNGRHYDDAVLTLELADQQAPTEEYTGRRLLFEVLLLSDRTTQAHAHAQRWIAAWRNPYYSGQLVLRIAQSGFRDLAVSLAERSASVLPSRQFEIINLLSANGHRDASQQLIVRWGQRVRQPDPLQLKEYVAAAIAAGDPSGPFLTLQHLIHTRTAPQAQVLIAEELVAAFGKAAFAPYRASLSYQALAMRPLFAATLAHYDGNAILARHFLRLCDVSALGATERATWLQLLRQVATEAELFTTLHELWNQKRLPEELVRVFAEEARRLGRPREHDAIWASLAQQKQR